MAAHEVECFEVPKVQQTPPQLKEWAQQLSRQQDALNTMTTGEYFGARLYYLENKRAGSAAKQKAMRASYEKKIAHSIQCSLLKNGASKAQAEKQAAERAKKAMDGLAALHEPDSVVSGSDVTRLGNSAVNSAIGGQWSAKGKPGYPSRVDKLDEAIHGAMESLGDESMVNVAMAICRR